MQRWQSFRLLHKWLMLLLLCTALRFAMVEVTHVQAQEPTRHDIILLLDNSRSISLRYDTNNKRTGFATFLVRYLQAFEPAGKSVGVARFGGTVSENGVTPLVPLQAVDQWAKADLQDLRTETCPPLELEPIMLIS